ncbi:MAG: phytanoyl-CoA dioxygenase family protein [Actinomycetota bacterium]
MDTRTTGSIDDAVAAGDWADVARRLAEGEGRDGDGRLVAETLRPDTIDPSDLHQIRQAYIRLRPDRPARPWQRRAGALAAALRRDGLVRVPGALSGERLARVQADIDTGLAAKEPVDFVMYDQKEYWQEEHQAWVFNDALELAWDLAWLCRNRWLVHTARTYLGKTPHIKRVYGMRYLPKEGIDSHQYGWHHDMEDRYLKVMVLLSDVEDDGQYMSYIRGTQNATYPRDRFFKNVLTWDDIDHEPDAAPVTRTIGKAGDAFLFDPNGMHRGIRSLGAPRDAIFIEFTADGNLGNVWGSKLGLTDPHLFGTTDVDPLHRFRNLEPKWERVKVNPRKHTTWIESLDDPDRWLRPSDVRRFPFRSRPSTAAVDVGQAHQPEYVPPPDQGAP